MTPAPKILVIDKDLDTLQSLDSLLKHEGYEVVTSSSAEDAMELVQNYKPSLVILDRVMLQMDGLEIVRRLRSNPNTEDILIVIFSALNAPNDQLEGFEAGVDDYLAKTVGDSELIARIKSVLQHAVSRANKHVRKKPDQQKKMIDGSLIGVMASKGGVGVSLLAANLGIALHQLCREPVIVADFRPGSSTMAAEVGAAGRTGLEKLLTLDPDVITSELIESRLFYHESGVRFLFASSSPSDAQYQPASNQYQIISRLLAAMSKYAVLDLGSSLTPAIRGVLSCAQQIILMMEPTPPSLFGTRLLLEDIHQSQTNHQDVKIVLSYHAQKTHFITADQVQEGIKKEISAALSYSPDLIFNAQLKTIPVILSDPESQIGSQIRSIAKMLLP